MSTPVGTRTNLNYLDQLAKFHKQHGTNLNRFPSVDKRPLDLYKLKKAVETRGGFDKVCKLKKWAEIGRILGYSGKIMSSLSTSLKNSYQKWLHPYEEYLRVAKPGVQQQLEIEYGGPFTPSAANSPMKRSNQDAPVGRRDESPAPRASGVVHASGRDADDPQGKPGVAAEPLRPSVSSGFTAINSSGFTPVNLHSASFQAVNTPNPSGRRESENGAPTILPRQGDGGLPPPKDGTEHGNSNSSQVHLTNGHSQNPLKRTISHDSVNGVSATDAGPGADGDDQNGRRSKRVKKGKSEGHGGAADSRWEALKQKS
jgi:histone demethylase JARID1